MIKKDKTCLLLIVYFIYSSIRNSNDTEYTHYKKVIILIYIYMYINKTVDNMINNKVNEFLFNIVS